MMSVTYAECRSAAVGAGHEDLMEFAGNSTLRVRFGTFDLLIKVACLVKK